MSRAANKMINQSGFSDAEISLRDDFITQYMIDYDPTAACTRLGFAKTYASKQGGDFMRCPYVRNKLVEVQANDKLEVTPESLKETKELAHARIRKLVTHGNLMQQDLAIKQLKLLFIGVKETPDDDNDIANTLAQTLADFAKRVDS